MGAPEFCELLTRRRIQRPTGVDARATGRISVHRFRVLMPAQTPADGHTCSISPAMAGTAVITSLTYPYYCIITQAPPPGLQDMRKANELVVTCLRPDL